MDRIRERIAGLILEEEMLLDQRNQRAQRLFLQAGLSTLLLVLLFGALGALYIRSLLIHRNQQLNLTNSLEQANQELEARVAERTRELTDANKVKSRFLANMSHELRTPLNAIIGFSQMIAQQRLGPIPEPRYVDYATQVEASGQHLLDLINDILDLSKIEAGKFSVHRELLDPVALAESCLAMLMPQATEGNVTLSFTAQAAPDECLADPKRLRQILLNLLSNAVKFTPPGKKVELRLEAMPHRQLAFVVMDQGCGMSAAEIALAMQPFVQLDNAASRSRQGTGLGLPLTKALVELHGGTFSLSSAPGQGTVARVEL